MKEFETGGGLGSTINEQNIISRWASLSSAEKERYWGLYQEVLKKQFEENRDNNLKSGDYSYFEQLIRSGQTADYQRYENMNERVNNISSTSGSMGLMLIFMLIMLIISLFKK